MTNSFTFCLLPTAGKPGAFSTDVASNNSSTASIVVCSASILKDLQEGKTVVIDRYAFSGVAYSMSKEHPAMDDAWCKWPDVGLPRPDRVFFLDLPSEVRVPLPPPLSR